jgi:hypothetical protein
MRQTAFNGLTSEITEVTAMTDEKYLFITDCAEKKRIARGIHNKRVHTGKGGSVKFPSDYLTRKERQQMNGDVKSYNLSKPMSWQIYKMLPPEIKREYFAALVEKHGGTQKDLALMFGISPDTIKVEARRFGIGFPKGNQSDERIRNWKAFLQSGETQDEFEPVPIAQSISEPPKMPTAVKPKTVQVKTAPSSGTLTFEQSTTSDALTMIYELLPKDAIGKLTVTWEL